MRRAISPSVRYSRARTSAFAFAARRALAIGNCPITVGGWRHQRQMRFCHDYSGLSSCYCPKYGTLRKARNADFMGTTVMRRRARKPSWQAFSVGGARLTPPQPARDGRKGEKYCHAAMAGCGFRCARFAGGFFSRRACERDGRPRFRSQQEIVARDRRRVHDAGEQDALLSPAVDGHQRIRPEVRDRNAGREGIGGDPEGRDVETVLAARRVGVEIRDHVVSEVRREHESIAAPAAGQAIVPLKAAQRIVAAAAADPVAAVAAGQGVG